VSAIDGFGVERRQVFDGLGSPAGTNSAPDRFTLTFSAVFGK
jgi:hypothetical protein